MNKTNLLILSLLIISSFHTQAIAQTITAKTTETTFEGVKLTESISLDDNLVKTMLKPVSYGIRKKTKFGLITVSVYVAEFFAAEPGQLKKTSEEILASLKKAGPVHLRLTVSRDLTGVQISDSFKEALKANNIDSSKTSQELTDVLTAVNDIKIFKSGEVFSLTVSWKNDIATLWIQKPDLSVQKISGPEKFATDLFSIWFGHPSDAKLEILKKALLK